MNIWLLFYKINGDNMAIETNLIIKADDVNVALGFQLVKAGELITAETLTKQFGKINGVEINQLIKPGSISNLGLQGSGGLSGTYGGVSFQQAIANGDLAYSYDSNGWTFQFLSTGKELIFTNFGTFGNNLQVAVVGGGGNGIKNVQPGGGGEVIQKNQVFAQNTKYTITIGKNSQDSSIIGGNISIISKAGGNATNGTEVGGVYQCRSGSMSNQKSGANIRIAYANDMDADGNVLNGDDSIYGWNATLNSKYEKIPLKLDDNKNVIYNKKVIVSGVTSTCLTGFNPNNTDEIWYYYAYPIKYTGEVVNGIKQYYAVEYPTVDSMESIVYSNPKAGSGSTITTIFTNQQVSGAGSSSASTRPGQGGGTTIDTNGKNGLVIVRNVR